MNIQTRGERNFNPGNIERNSTQWQGMAEEQQDTRFITFDTPEHGIRALAKILLTYYRKYGYSTVQEIIDHWAPPEENDTSAYVAHVAEVLGIAPDKDFNVENVVNLELLVKAIITHENGRCVYDDKTIQDGIDQALA